RGSGAGIRLEGAGVAENHPRPRRRLSRRADGLPDRHPRTPGPECPALPRLRADHRRQGTAAAGFLPPPGLPAVAVRLPVTVARRGQGIAEPRLRGLPGRYVTVPPPVYFLPGAADRNLRQTAVPPAATAGLSHVAPPDAGSVCRPV